MNSLKESEGAPTFKLWGCPWCHFLNLRGVPGPGSEGPGSQGPGPTFTPCHNSTSFPNLLTITKNDEILETERGNSSPSSNSKKTRETQAESLSRKKKSVLTEDSMVNGISENGLVVNHKVKIEKLDDIIKKRPDDFIIHVETNDLINNVNLFDQEIFHKISKESPLTFIAFSSIINRKNKINIEKILTDTNAFEKYLHAKKELILLVTAVLRNFIDVRENFIWTRKLAEPLQKILLHLINKTDWSFFPMT